jgi:ParB family chromosome partitioning protein
VPVLVSGANDQAAAAMALVENMQREDLNPLEESQGLARLIEEFGFTHEQAAKAVGKSRSAVTNLLRLNQLAKPVQAMLLAGDIDMGHARALLAVDAAVQIQLANQIIAKRLSVRDAEALVTRTTKEPINKTGAQVKGISRDVIRLEEALSDQLGTKVTLKVASKGRGQLIIDFHGWDHCSALIEKLNLKEEIDA